MRPAFTAFLLGDLLAALAAGALIVAGQTVAGIVVGVVILAVATAIGVRRLRG